MVAIPWGMARFHIDTVLRLRSRHRPGQLARVATVIAQEGALIGEITTIHMVDGLSTRDVTVETLDEDHTARVIDALRAMDGVEVLEVKDRVFEVHRGGKIRATSTVELSRLVDLRYIYTPGVARVSRAIAANPKQAWEYTNIGRSIGIFTNGTRVLGLGNIGVLASMPVMEGKAVLYDKFSGLSATPLLVDTLDVGEFVDTVVRLSKSFGGIHLEDIRIPECFAIEQELKRRLKKPVMHDDQHGTAVVTLAALINASKLTRRSLKELTIAQVGLGAAGSAIANLILSYGTSSVMVADVNQDMVMRVVQNGARAASFEQIMQTADVVICTTGRVGLIKPEMIRPGQVIFALSNPHPEIDPDLAKKAGAAYAADGTAINNALAFPGIFAGALEARARSIEPQMLIAAAEAIAESAQEGEMVPSPLDLAVHAHVRAAVARCAIELGLQDTAEL